MSRKLSSICIRRFIATASSNQCTLGRTADQLRTLPPVGYVYLGEVPYHKALEIQTKLSRRRIDEIYGNTHTSSAGIKGRMLSDVLILLQHPPVYTNGRRNRGKLSSEEVSRLNGLGCDYVETNRGGEITFHGPGQLVAYPIMYLKDHHLATRCYVEGLEHTVARTCAHFGIKAKGISGFPGVWTSPTQKIAALGTHVQRYVTSHGFALNCTTDMKWFREIVPCGLDGRTAVSMQALLEQQKSSVDVSIDAVLPVVVKSFGQIFGCDVRPLSEVSPATLNVINKLLRQ
ncbi:lipoyltransferase [Coemansia reversa NRRL 1564]|uniref:lipoyl(octanoyl) transferase n=1 Tax=Coemansia reversa (strain ATCC 12441 / NRRL 1564) TaxID=763665 RepID=A0A2G5BH60_COERN|nr:lipoyltransferase [Coemansia reversa NRRL 1564]|eukprot:PIA18067.1 lipoyltransferase [Coemansia reversa NRRL 1564]